MDAHDKHERSKDHAATDTDETGNDTGHEREC